MDTDTGDDDNIDNTQDDDESQTEDTDSTADSDESDDDVNNDGVVDDAESDTDTEASDDVDDVQDDAEAVLEDDDYDEDEDPGELEDYSDGDNINRNEDTETTDDSESEQEEAEEKAAEDDKVAADRAEDESENADIENADKNIDDAAESENKNLSENVTKQQTESAETVGNGDVDSENETSYIGENDSDETRSEISDNKEDTTLSEDVANKSDISSETRENLGAFEQNNWDTLSQVEKEQAVEKLRDSIAEDLQLGNRPDIAYYNNEDPGDYGGYAASNNTIYINRFNMDAAAETADTIAHESRHCWQHERADNPETEQDYQFKVNFEDYVRPEDDFYEYQNQPVEADARGYAQEIKDSIPISDEIPDMVRKTKL